jgi:predicted  nucleic acid-binding Zn-ribbon protein
MEPTPAGLRPVEAVRCLGCGKEYAKLGGRGTLSTNPGCPECGYVGWLPTAKQVSPTSLRGRSAADRRRLRTAQSG